VDRRALRLLVLRAAETLLATQLDEAAYREYERAVDAAGEPFLAEEANLVFKLADDLIAHWSGFVKGIDV
jgi:hypothetical protein